MNPTNYGCVCLSQLPTWLKTTFAYWPAVGLMIIFACLFFPYSTFQQIVLIFTGVGYVLDYVVNQRWKDWCFSPYKWVYIACMVYFLLLPLWMIISIEPSKDVHSYMETYLPFAILGLVGFCGVSRAVKVEWFALVALSVVSVVSLFFLSQIECSHG